MISEKEKKQIQRYCVYPKIAIVAIAVSVVLCILLVPLEMIDGLVFHSAGGSQLAGSFTILGLIAVYMVIFCYCALASRCGMVGKRWKALRDRLNVKLTNTDYSQQIAASLATQASGRLLRKIDNKTARQAGGALEVAGAINAVATASAVLGETAKNAEAMAIAYAVPVPKIKKWLAAFAILPILVVIVGCYVPQYVQSYQKMQENSTFAAEQINIVKEALTPICEYVSADDPKEDYRDSGYSVIGRLRERAANVMESYVYLKFDESGTITSISYYDEIDVRESFEENLRRIEQDIEILQAPLENLDVSVENPELLALYRLPDEFKEAFLSGTFYDDIVIHTDYSSVRISCQFHTYSEEEFDEDSHPYVYVSLSDAN